MKEKIIHMPATTATTLVAQVNKGIGVTSIMTGVLGILHCLVSFWLLPKPTLGDAKLVLGIFLGATCLIFLLYVDMVRVTPRRCGIQQCWWWGGGGAGAGQDVDGARKHADRVD